MADSTVLEPTPVPAADLARAEKFAREPFVLEGEEAGSVLAPGTARRRALDAALAEVDAGRKQPSVEWRQQFSLMLGLERTLNDEEPHLADGTTLSAHQVDALSGTLIALMAEAQDARSNGNGSRNGAAAAVEELPSGEVELEGDEEIGDEEPLDWDEPEAEADEGPTDEALADDRNAARRFWF